MSAEQSVIDLVRGIRQQIHEAEDAGADHEDLCICVPTSYLSVVVGAWPTVDVSGHVVAVVPKIWARDLCDQLLAEIAGPPLDLGAGGGGGLWGFTESTKLPTPPLSPAKNASEAAKLWNDQLF